MKSSLSDLRSARSHAGVVDERADGDPQDTSDVIDERAQEPHVLGASDQTGLLGGFAVHRVLEGFPGRHVAARQFEGAAAVQAQQDALFTEQDRSDADGRVRFRRSGAAGSAGDARRPGRGRAGRG